MVKIDAEWLKVKKKRINLPGLIDATRRATACRRQRLTKFDVPWLIDPQTPESITAAIATTAKPPPENTKSYVPFNFRGTVVQLCRGS
jgi:hypothetical protein